MTPIPFIIAFYEAHRWAISFKTPPNPRLCITPSSTVKASQQGESFLYSTDLISVFCEQCVRCRQLECLTINLLWETKDDRNILYCFGSLWDTYDQ